MIHSGITMVCCREMDSVCSMFGGALWPIMFSFAHMVPGRHQFRKHKFHDNYGSGPQSSLGAVSEPDHSWHIITTRPSSNIFQFSMEDILLTIL